MTFLEFVSPPPGEAPEEVRAAWVGLRVPVTKKESRLVKGMPVVGVCSGPQGFWAQLWALVTRRVEYWNGYAIASAKCIELLHDHAPAAAAWWAQHAPRYLKSKSRFVFPAECCAIRNESRRN